MTEIWAEWRSGEVECVDSADSESEAIYLVNEYRMAFGEAATRIWTQHGRQEENAESN